MPDISACKGDNCLLRLNCHRYTCAKEPLGQSYFSEPPYKMEFMFDDNHNGFGVAIMGCAYFWNNKKFENETSRNKSGLGDGI